MDIFRDNINDVGPVENLFYGSVADHDKCLSLHGKIS
jgi:hypothetical protein